MPPDEHVPTDDPIHVGVLMSRGVAREMVLRQLQDLPGITLHDLMLRSEAEGFPLPALDVIIVGTAGIYLPRTDASIPAALDVIAVDTNGGTARLLRVTEQQPVIEVTPESLAGTVRRLGKRIERAEGLVLRVNPS